MSSNTPQNLRYSKSHEWVRLEEDGTCTVGISDYAQSELGDIVFVELPMVGDNTAAGQECAVIESVKSAADLYSPIAGSISEVNHELEADPSLINTSPYEQGWIFKITPTDKDSFQLLMNAEDYQSHIS